MEVTVVEETETINKAVDSAINRTLVVKVRRGLNVAN
jgi:hypothetical protein